MKLGTTIIEGVVKAHCSIFKTGSFSAPDGSLNFSKNAEFDCSDYHLCGQWFLKNCLAEFNEIWHNNYIEGVVDARCSIFKIGSFSALWWNMEL